MHLPQNQQNNHKLPFHSTVERLTPRPLRFPRLIPPRRSNTNTPIPQPPIKKSHRNPLDFHLNNPRPCNLPHRQIPPKLALKRKRPRMSRPGKLLRLTRHSPRMRNRIRRIKALAIRELNVDSFSGKIRTNRRNESRNLSSAYICFRWRGRVTPYLCCFMEGIHAQTEIGSVDAIYDLVPIPG